MVNKRGKCLPLTIFHVDSVNVISIFYYNVLPTQHTKCSKIIIDIGYFLYELK